MKNHLQQSTIIYLYVSVEYDDDQHMKGKRQHFSISRGKQIRDFQFDGLSFTARLIQSLYFKSLSNATLR